MKGIFILAHKVNYDSGVMVSVRHLSKVLENAGIAVELDFYKDDDELKEKALSCRYSCLNIQGLSFRDETLHEILKTHENVVVSIHSTMCNLQVEGDAFPRLLRWGKEGRNNLKFTCPSESETLGLNSFMKTEYIYLPNTFSLQTDKEKIRERILDKKISGRPVKISLVCAYRPFKNMITQAVAVIMLAKKIPVELHMFDTEQKSPVYQNLMEMLDDSGVSTVLHKQEGNAECFKKEGEFDLGLQVSLSETFSYVAFEHMIQGVPVVGSTSVPFAGEVAQYSNVLDMEEKIAKILSDDLTYRRYSLDAYNKAVEIRERNNVAAQEAVLRLI